MITAVGRDDHEPADLLASGAAMDVWRSMIKAQGGNPDADLPTARETDVITAERDGVLQSLDALAVGEAAWRLGAGRARKEHAVQPGAGVVLHAKPGTRVRAGQPLLTLYTDTPERFSRARESLQGAYTIGETAPAARELILDRIA
jgi:thymidine phosphorylase